MAQVFIHELGAVIPVPCLVVRFGLFEGQDPTMPEAFGTPTGELDAHH